MVLNLLENVFPWIGYKKATRNSFNYSTTPNTIAGLFLVFSRRTKKNKKEKTRSHEQGWRYRKMSLRTL